MAIPYDKFINRYEQSYQGTSIDYQDDSGNQKTDTGPRFKQISSDLQSRGRISRADLRNIGTWKSPRIDRHLKKNQNHEVVTQSRMAFQATTDKDAVEPLLELDGVGVPVASTVLTMLDPSQYAIIDFRALRALGLVKSQPLDPQHYPEYAEFLDHFRNYSDSIETYEFYMDEVRQIGHDEGLLPREVEMALWAFDEAV